MIFEASVPSFMHVNLCVVGEWNGTTVAVKVLQHPEEEDGGSILEALLSTQISHPNIVSVNC